MFDIGLIRHQREAVEVMLRRRGEVAPLDEIVALDSRRAELAGRATSLGEERNRLSQQIGRLPAPERPAMIARTRELREELKRVEEQLASTEEALHALLLTVPNVVAPDAPDGPDETANVEVRRWGTPREFEFAPRDHVELMLGLNLLDLEHASKVAGTRTYYLMNEAVYLELALVRLALDTLAAAGFRPVVPPVMVRERALWASRYFPFFRDQIYKIEGHDFYLVGTSEVSLSGLHIDEILEEKALPALYVGFSSCFRTELGSGGRDIRGLMRTHQFDKVEMFAFTKPEDSAAMHERMVGLEERIFQRLEIPYRVTEMCTGDLGALAYRKYDLEAWKPSDGVYREVTSCSNYVDFQARGTNTRYRPEGGGRPQYVHTLNGTGVAVGRALVAVVENHQQADGSVVVPEALRGYMPGALAVIRPR